MRKYNRKIHEIIETTPLIREDIRIEVSIMPTWGKGLWLYIDYGKDIAYRCSRVDAEELVKIDIPGFTKTLFAIVSSWQEEMVNKFILDGTSYSVKINKDGKEFKFYGQNEFPDNFDEFMYLLHCNNLY